jgi:hypothetical protein
MDKLRKYRSELKRSIKGLQAVSAKANKPWDRGCLAGQKAALHYFEELFAEELKRKGT